MFGRMLHSMASGCPLPVLRPTGPITAFMGDIAKLASSIDSDFFDLLSWTGVWVGTLMIIISMFDLSAYICLCTRFLHDIYAVFVWSVTECFKMT